MALGVPEIWRYDGKRAQIYQLSGAAYVEASDSRFFPHLESATLSESLESSKTQGQTEALAAFRQRIRAWKV